MGPTAAELDLVQSPDLEPAACRSLSVFGASVELVWLPHRAGRGGVPGRRPAFREAVAERILAEETVWRSADGAVAATPNKFPFGRQQTIFWSTRTQREPSLELLETLGTTAAAVGGTALLNSIGAAASIPHTHGHLVRERLPFLEGLAEVHEPAPWLDRRDDVEVLRKDALPFLLLGLRGPGRFAAGLRTLELRLTPAFSAVDDGTTLWIQPRSVEIPHPHFPQALGAAEAWGRWCYMDETAFTSATGPMLERALTESGVPG